jgi:hypothetical protein
MCAVPLSDGLLLHVTERSVDDAPSRLDANAFDQVCSVITLDANETGEHVKNFDMARLSPSSRKRSWSRGKQFV